MLAFPGNMRIYLACGITDMRKGIHGLSVLVDEHLSHQVTHGCIYVFRGRRGDRIKLLWWDGQGFCLYYKCLERGKFTWPVSVSGGSISITGAQLAMLMEGVDWRMPQWSSPPTRVV